MTPFHIFRNSMLTGVFVGLMTGCSWLEDWPPQGSELARKTAPRPPEASSQTDSAGNKWLGGDKDEPANKAAAASAAAALPEAGTIAQDPAAEDRIGRLEASVEQISNDLKMMMPALTRMAAAQGDIQKNFNALEPAAGAAAAAQRPPAPSQNAGPQPGTVAWYEEQERKKREAALSAQQPVFAAAGFPQPAASAPPVAVTAPSQQASGAPSIMNGWPVGPSGQQQPAYQPPPAAQPSYAPAPSYAPPPAPSYAPPQQAAYAPPAYQPQTAPPPAVYQPAAGGYSSSGFAGAGVTGIRFGEHPGKTRLVLDTSSRVAFSYDVDANEQIVMINLPGAGWQGAPQMMVANSPLVASYSVTADGQGGQRLILQLKRPGKVLWAQALDPSGPQGHRVVLDLAPL